MKMKNMMRKRCLYFRFFQKNSLFINEIDIFEI